MYTHINRQRLSFKWAFEMDSSETKNLIRSDGHGVEYAVPGRPPTIVDTWRLFKTSSSARKVLAPLIIIPFYSASLNFVSVKIGFLVSQGDEESRLGPDLTR